MFKCVSGKHTWMDAQCAACCCNSRYTPVRSVAREVLEKSNAVCIRFSGGIWSGWEKKDDSMQSDKDQSYGFVMKDEKYQPHPDCQHVVVDPEYLNLLETSLIAIQNRIKRNQCHFDDIFGNNGRWPAGDLREVINKRRENDGLSVIPTVGWSQFAIDQHSAKTGNSYFTLDHDAITELVITSWNQRYPGIGEKDLTRKVVVPIKQTLGFYCPPRIKLQENMNVFSEVKVRQKGEDPYVVNFVLESEAIKYGFKPIEAVEVEIVCYHKEALLENNGTRSTDCDWEIVCVIAKSQVGDQPMMPLTMARNFLQKTGGTKSEYTAQEFAEAIYHHSTGGIRVKFESIVV